jgi:hypothetical protein
VLEIIFIRFKRFVEYGQLDMALEIMFSFSYLCFRPTLDKLKDIKILLKTCWKLQ